MQFSKLYALAIAAIFLTSCGNDVSNADTTATDSVSAKHDYTALRTQVDSIAKTLDGKVAFAMMDLETGDTFSYNGREHMPMQSTYKFPLGLAVLDIIDKGKLSLDQKVLITKAEMSEETYSPIQQKYGEKQISIGLHEILYYTVAQSDNIGCDALFKLVGGPKSVDSFIQAHGFKGINIESTEAEMHRQWKKQYDNWTEPVEMVNILAAFYKGKILSAASTDTLRYMMERTTTGAARIKGLLPEGTVVAHKTGTGGTVDGFSRAVNDIGIVTLPNGRHIAMAVYICDVHGTGEACEAAIAQIARAAYDDAVKN